MRNKNWCSKRLTSFERHLNLEYRAMTYFLLGCVRAWLSAKVISRKTYLGLKRDIEEYT